MEHDLQYERKIIDLLGFHLGKMDASNRFPIYDENEKAVGFIQYKKIYKRNKKRDLPASYGYKLEIETDKVNMHHTRVIDKELPLKQSYTCLFKQDDGSIDKLYLSFGESSHFCLENSCHGTLELTVNERDLYFSLQYQIGNKKMEELVTFRSDGEEFSFFPKEYTYQNRHFKDEDEWKEEPFYINEFYFCSEQDDQINQEVHLRRTQYEEGINSRTHLSILKGTIEETIKKHRMGIDALKKFNELANERLPFKKDIITILLEEMSDMPSALSLFTSIGEELKNKQKKLQEN